MVADLLDRRRGLTFLLCVMAAAILLAAFAVHLVLFPDLPHRIGIDYAQYTAGAQRWLSGAGFYQPWQLSGPYLVPHDEFNIDKLPVLYPPIALVLLLPFAVAPAVIAPAWWLVPIGITAAVVAWHRPKPWTWPFIVLCVLSADTMWLTISGNPAMWIMAALALATVWGWPSLAVMLKPSLFPFALVGASKRSWWISLPVAIAIAAPFAGMWADYFTALTNEQGIDVLYSTTNIPMLCIPLLAWVGAGRDRGAASGDDSHRFSLRRRSGDRTG